MEMLAVHAPRRLIDLALAHEIHERWFESTFPGRCRHQRDPDRPQPQEHSAVAVDASSCCERVRQLEPASRERCT
ncbi:MAG: hypothetical protein R2736_21650 [Solirubrobacterales bacterium]